MITKESFAASAPEREVMSRRLLSAPRAQVYRAFAETGHLARWWGPQGFRNTIQEFDLQPGGHWRLVMHGPDGTDYANESVFDVVESEQRIVFRHLSPHHEFQMTILLAERDGGTELTWHMQFPGVAELERVKSFVVLANEQNFDRLEAELTRMQELGPPFTITRLLDAPRERVWRAWTSREELPQWFGPTGTQIERCDLGLRLGGRFLYGLRRAEGDMIWGRWIFEEISAPERLVNTVAFSDEQGGVVPHPLVAKWPLEMLSTLQLEARGEQTWLTLEWRPIHATPEEQQVFAAHHDSMRAGWGGTLDRLTAHLAPTTDKT